MLDFNSTSLDWQTHPTRVCVTGIGACEQHSRHLPLDTDSIFADYFARAAAEDLDAALFPTLRYGNSLEHTGFRGTMTLRPETLMQIVRDLADEIERQNFTRWIIINGHGGNFALTPVVRDINRMDRRLKILLVPFWEFSDPGIASDSASKGTEIHSGEWETSLLLALAPDRVRASTEEATPAQDDPLPLRQSDLTTFGVGCFCASGAIGWPSYASAEKGRRIAESIRRNMMAHIRDRLRRLDEQPRYAGTGGIALRPMLKGDIADGMRLKRIAGWNQIPADWEFFLSRNPEGCFVAVQNGRVVGTIASMRYGRRASWIGMVLVDPAFRRMGIATRLMRQTMDHLADCVCAKLDATPAGQPVYEKLVFAAEGVFKRMTVRAVPRLSGLDSGGTPLVDADLDEAARFDAAAFGVDRRAVLQHLRSLAPQLAWKVLSGGQIAAVCFGRPGANAYQIGPVVAESVPAARAVLGSAFLALSDRPVVMDVPEVQRDFTAWLEQLGFVEERPFVRMYRGENLTPEHPGFYFASAGPELG